MDYPTFTLLAFNNNEHALMHLIDGREGKMLPFTVEESRLRVDNYSDRLDFTGTFFCRTTSDNIGVFTGRIRNLASNRHFAPSLHKLLYHFMLMRSRSSFF